MVQSETSKMSSLLRVMATDRRCFRRTVGGSQEQGEGAAECQETGRAPPLPTRTRLGEEEPHHQEERNTRNQETQISEGGRLGHAVYLSPPLLLSVPPRRGRQEEDAVSSERRRRIFLRTEKKKTAFPESTLISRSKGLSSITSLWISPSPEEIVVEISLPPSQEVRGNWLPGCELDDRSILHNSLAQSLRFLKSSAASQLPHRRYSPPPPHEFSKPCEFLASWTPAADPREADARLRREYAYEMELQRQEQQRKDDARREVRFRIKTEEAEKTGFRNRGSPKRPHRRFRGGDGRQMEDLPTESWF